MALHLPCADDTICLALPRRLQSPRPLQTFLTALVIVPTGFLFTKPLVVCGVIPSIVSFIPHFKLQPPGVALLQAAEAWARAESVLFTVSKCMGLIASANETCTL
jgi:hypothetical protein